jgi:hypothetical protein
MMKEPSLAARSQEAAMQQDPGQSNTGVSGSSTRRRRGYRSLFWPIVLIGAGILWLLFNLDVLAADHARVLSLLWPILIVGIGVDLLLGRRSLVLGAVVGIVTIGLIIVLMLVGPSAGWVKGGEVTTRSMTAAVGQATSARVEIDTGPYSSKVHALPPSTGASRPLLAASLSYRGSLHFESTGGTESNVILESRGRGWWFSWWDEDGTTPWDIGLDPAIPIALTFRSGSGSGVLDLSGLTLSSLEVDVSSGELQLSLPQGGGQAYTTKIDISSGDLQVGVPAGASTDMSIDMSSGDTSLRVGRDTGGRIGFDGSSGEFSVELAADQAYRIEVQQVSSGDVTLPSGLVQVGQGDGDEGIWETPAYATAAAKLLITIEISSGDVTIRRGE